MQHATTVAAARGGLAQGRTGGLLLREVLIPGAFVAAILISNYAMSSLPNVKLFDLLVLTAGYALGFRRGGMVAVAAWLVYGRINPFGVAHAQLLVTLMAAEVGYAGAGALIRMLVPPSRLTLRPGVLNLVLLAAALVATGAYDLVTNAYTGYFWANVAGTSDYGRWIPLAMFNAGALFFMMVHVGANAMLFPVFGPLLMKGAERGKNSLGWR